MLCRILRWRMLWISLVVLLVVTMVLGGCQPVRRLPAGATGTAPTGAVYEVFPTGDPARDIASVQAAIDGAKDGDTILLKAGTFSFGDWKTNPSGGGHVVITKGVTLKGEGVDADGNPATVIQGGGYRMKNHWKEGEIAVIAFGGDGKGGAVDGLWLQQPHMYAIGINGLMGQNHENITVRNVKVTEPSHDIPEWDQNVAIARPLDFGGNVPEWGNGGPLGTLTIENCDISNVGTAVELDYIDPETGTPYYRNPDGEALSSVDSQGIGLYMSTATDFVVRGNKIAMQNEGIVTEGMGGTGSILISGNDISIETGALTPHVRHGYRLDGWPAEWAPVPFARELHIENNHIRVVGEPEPAFYTAGLLMGGDNGLPGYAGKIVVANNKIEMENGDAGIVFTEIQIDPLHEGTPNVLNGAEVHDNLISGTAQYGLLANEGAKNCKMVDNDMRGLTTSMATVGLYGAHTYGNAAAGDGTYIEAEGAHDNAITGYKESARRSIQGKALLPSVETWGGVAVSMDLDVKETDSGAHTATGPVHWRVFQPNPPAGEAFWKDVDANAQYVFFGSDEEGGDPNTAVVIAEITNKDGWGQGVPGEYGYFWFRDNGAEQPDQWGMRYYTLDPWYEFFPVGEPPVEGGYFTVEEMQADDSVLPLDFENGYVTITQ